MLDAVASWPEREAGFLKPGRVDTGEIPWKYIEILRHGKTKGILDSYVICFIKCILIRWISFWGIIVLGVLLFRCKKNVFCSMINMNE